MIGDARFSVFCDGPCGETFDDYEGTALAGGAYDTRNIPRQLESEGWLVEGDKTFCPECKDEVGEPTQETEPE